MVIFVVLAQWALAVCLFAVGWWGRRASELVDGCPADRAEKAQVLRRGALACRAVAVFFVLMTLPTLIRFDAWV